MAEDKDLSTSQAKGDASSQAAPDDKSAPQEPVKPQENGSQEAATPEADSSSAGAGDAQTTKQNGEDATAAAAAPTPKDMRAIVLSGFGGLKGVKSLKKPEPQGVAENEVLVKVKTCGLNFLDLIARQGSLDSPPKPPFIMGFECAGEIEQVGEGVKDLKVGDRVVALPDYKAWAEYVTVPATSVYALPAGMSFNDATAITLNYTVAHILLFEIANLTPGKSILVQSAGGGVGQALVQLAKTVKDITIFGVASKSKHEALQSAGLIDHLLERGTDYAAAVKKESPKGVDIVFDCLYGEECNRGYGLLKPLGKYILFGLNNVSENKAFAAAKLWWQVNKMQPMKLYDENKTICGFNFRHLLYQQENHEYVRGVVKKVFDLWEEGKIKPVIDSTFALEDVTEAMQKMHEHKNIGKILLDLSLEPKPKPATPAKSKGKDKKNANQEEKKSPSAENEEAEKKAPELTNGTSEEKSESGLNGSRRWVTRPSNEVDLIEPQFVQPSISNSNAAPLVSTPTINSSSSLSSPKLRRTNRGYWSRELNLDEAEQRQLQQQRAEPPTGGPGAIIPGTNVAFNPSTVGIDEAFCDFGPLPSQSLCEWQDGCGAVKWTPGTGVGAHWLGGPLTDSTSGTSEGGYAFVDCSQPATTTKSPNSVESVSLSPFGLLHGPQLGNTGVLGTCLMFKYTMDGLSAAGLRLLLHHGYDDFSSTASRASSGFGNEGQNETAKPVTRACGGPALTATATATPLQGNLGQHLHGPDEKPLWHAHYHLLGTWQQAHILYTYHDIHTLIFEAIPVEIGDPSRSYKGHIAIDDIDLQPGTACTGFCNFAGGFCDWTNDIDDDFDWSLSHGSNNPTTGPVTDRESSSLGGGGGYTYIDSGWPRRPGDVARLISVSMPSTGPDSPLCLRFAFHMFGSGVGELKVSLRHSRSLDPTLQEIWKLRGNAGNAWFDSRVSLSSTDDYQIVFEASVGSTAMGDIAVDDISFTSGPCPTSPQVAAPPHYPHDCTFEIDECEWLNSREPALGTGSSSSSSSGPSGVGHLGGPLGSTGPRVEWERVSQQTLNPRNQRKPYTLPATRPRQEYFMGLQSRGVSPAGSPSAYLLGSLVKPTGEPICISFWYLMFESFIDAAGPSLGVLRVLVQPVGESLDAALPIWQLYNNQGPSWNYGQASIVEKRDFHILFEGTWGPNRATGNIAIDDIAFYTGNCTVKPNSAQVRPEDCSFEKGLCGWENLTSSGVNDPRMQWQRAFPNHRPAQLLDKTFGATGDFVFFDIFSPSMRREVRLRSPLIGVPLDDDATCFSFWFVAFGVEETTSLRLLKLSGTGGGGQDSSSIGESADDDESSEQQVLWTITAKGFNNLRPSWTWAQVTIEARSPYRLILEGSASNGGFAIDDVKFQPGICPIRPAVAKPAVETPEF
ncbi:hypothetical protein QAD02_017848 [Eretmocerus hayati]|uniref:Uncharacterized protein n=1 Tax=Eretmocerus hayati TaxID=131215 RepID=A0ACC2PF03_9HYME|nr:hypothetical protein QAD02_017848 [Eretmocerus hayati]